MNSARARTVRRWAESAEREIRGKKAPQPALRRWIYEAMLAAWKRLSSPERREVTRDPEPMLLRLLSKMRRPQKDPKTGKPTPAKTWPLRSPRAAAQLVVADLRA